MDFDFGAGAGGVCVCVCAWRGSARTRRQRAEDRRDTALRALRVLRVGWASCFMSWMFLLLWKVRIMPVEKAFAALETRVFPEKPNWRKSCAKARRKAGIAAADGLPARELAHDVAGRADYDHRHLALAEHQRQPRRVGGTQV